MRSTRRIWTERVNVAIRMLKGRGSVSAATKTLMEKHGVSRRQAYRYVLEAKGMRQVAALPEENVVFTVKLPKTLAMEVRRFAKRSGGMISMIVTRALETFLRRGR